MIFSTTYPPKFPRFAMGGYRYFFNGQESDGEAAAFQKNTIFARFFYYGKEDL